MAAPYLPPEAQLEISSPRRFTTVVIILYSIFGIAILGLPLLAALTVVSSLKVHVVWVIFIPLVVFAASAFFLPFGLCNPHIAWSLRALKPSDGSKGFVVQITMNPRIKSGLRALLEDADDIGYLVVSKTGLLFRGDSLQMTLPKELISRIEARNIGLRGLFVYGPVIEIGVNGLAEIKSIRIAERQSALLPTSRRITQELLNELRALA